MPHVKAFTKLEDNPSGNLWNRVEAHKDNLRRWIAAEEKYKSYGTIKISEDGEVRIGFARTDLGRLYYHGVGNIWIECDMSYTAYVDDVTFTDEEVSKIKRDMDEFIQANLAQLEKEKRFYEWVFGDGRDRLTASTPEEALALIEAEGF
jgi:hypothetical protein